MSTAAWAAQRCGERRQGNQLRRRGLHPASLGTFQKAEDGLVTHVHAPARPGEFPIKVARPKYSVLENQALKSKSLNVFTHWKEGLESYLARRAQSANLISA